MPMLDMATRFRTFVVPVTFRAPPKSDAAFRVVTFVVERFEALVTLRVVAKRLVAFMMAAFPLV